MMSIPLQGASSGWNTSSRSCNARGVPSFLTARWYVFSISALPSFICLMMRAMLNSMSRGSNPAITWGTGYFSPQELEDEDLNQAMQELNIKPQPLTAEEEAALAGQEGAQPAAPAPAAPIQSGGADYIAELEKLADLRDRGIITSEEFEAKKKQLLGL